MTFAEALCAFRRRERLSQLALAERSGVSQRHISFLESGRSKPGGKSVAKLAGALNLTYADANALYASAGLSRPRAAFDFSDPEFDPSKRAIDRLLRSHMPYPAVMTLRSGDILQTNAAFDKAIDWAFEGKTPWRDSARAHDNLFELTLHPEGLRQHMVNPDEIIPHTLRRLRAAAIEDSLAKQVFDRVAACVGIEDYASVDETPSSAASSVLVERYRIGNVALNLVSMVASFGSPEDVTAQTIQIELFFPNDAKSETTVERLNNQADL